MIFYRTLCGIDAVIALIALYFFVVGLGDGSVSSFNILLWLTMLGGIAAILGGGLLLKANKKMWPANGVLLILAAPGFLFGLLFLMLIILQPDWR